MNRLLALIFLLAPFSLSAQTLFWITPCVNDTFCLNQGSCTEGNVFMVEKAATACFNGPIINYSYKIDLFNNGGTDIQSAQDTVTGSFPIGTHKIIWRAADNCANVIQCTYLFTIKDCQAPGLICINSLSQNLDLNCNATFYATDFILNASDNCTPSGELQFGIRETGGGTGFPNETSVIFDACDIGSHNVQIWAKDENNLTNLCNSIVVVQNSQGSCDCFTDVSVTLQGCARTADSARLDNFTVRGDLTSGAINMFLQKNTTDSCYAETFQSVPLNSDCQIVVRVRRDGGWLVGVTTFDLLQTSKHILNILPFQTAYQRLAADVNMSNSVTTFDIVETRKLILGIYDTFPVAPSWQFVRPLSDPSNLLGAVKDTYQITLNNLVNDTTLVGLDFVGVKMGDVNLSATFKGSTDDRNALILNVEDRLLNEEETISIPIRLAETTTLEGWQIGLKIDPELAKIENVEGLPDEDFSISGNEVRALWFDATGKRFSRNEAIFYLKIKALQPASLSQILSLPAEKFASEAYAPAGNRRPLLLGFSIKIENDATFFPPRPNPFGAEAAFGLLLPRPCEALLEVFDISGKKIFAKNSEIGAGYQTLTLPAADLPSEVVLFYRIQANGEVFSGRLVRH
jgi:hypothetical protein